MDIERRGDLAGDLRVVADGHGNVTIVWTRDTSDDDLPYIHAIRYAPATGDVSPITVLSEVDSRYPEVGVDAAGNVAVIWTARAVIRGVSRRVVHLTDWIAAPNAPAITWVRTGSGALSVGFSPPATGDPAFAPTTYEYSLDDGTTWIPRIPASTVSPIRVGSLVDGVAYAVRVRAVNGAGPGLMSGASVATPLPAPEAPADLRVMAQSGNMVTIAWTASAGGIPPSHYALEGGKRPGEVMAGISPITSTSVPPTFTFTAPTGAYYVRVHAVAGIAWSPPSNEIRIFVNVPAPPLAPMHLRGLVNGSTLGLSWTYPTGGPAPAGLWLNVTGSAVARLALPVGEVFTFANVPPGTYTLSVSAWGAGGTSEPSNSVTLTFPHGCTGVPDAPTSVRAWADGPTIFLAWNPPVTGSAIASYTAYVSGAFEGTFPTTNRVLSGLAAPGRYDIRVTATNACGMGPSSPTVTIVIP